MSEVNWHGKPYYSLDAWCKNTFQHKCYKVALNAHMTCPNRDGTLGTRGCIFCSAGGSGDFAVDLEATSHPEKVASQLRAGIDKIIHKMPFKPTKAAFVIAYFQAYTNTYAPLSYLKQIFTQVLSSSFVCGISIATRPDCIPDEVIDLLLSLRKGFPEKFIWIELGLQTIHEETAAYIRRGYPLSCFEDTMLRLKQAELPAIVHLILGLPGEKTTEMLASVAYLNRFEPFGVKLQLLHVLSGTDLAEEYLSGKFPAMDKETYLQTLIRCLELLSPDIVIHRVTGDGAKEHLIAPLWSSNKRDVLNSLHTKMKEQQTWQGIRFHSPYKARRSNPTQPNFPTGNVITPTNKL